MSEQQQEFGNNVSPTEPLIAYRLGRLEKAVEHINTNSISRDDKILEKLEQMSVVTQKVSENTWRIQSLEGSRTNTYRFLGVLGTAVIMMIIEKVFNLF